MKGNYTQNLFNTLSSMIIYKVYAFYDSTWVDISDYVLSNLSFISSSLPDNFFGFVKSDFINIVVIDNNITRLYLPLDISVKVKIVYTMNLEDYIFIGRTDTTYIRTSRVAKDWQKREVICKSYTDILKNLEGGLFYSRRNPALARPIYDNYPLSFHGTFKNVSGFLDGVKLNIVEKFSSSEAGDLFKLNSGNYRSPYFELGNYWVDLLDEIGNSITIKVTDWNSDKGDIFMFLTKQGDIVEWAINDHIYDTLLTIKETLGLSSIDKDIPYYVISDVSGSNALNDFIWRGHNEITDVAFYQYIINDEYGNEEERIVYRYIIISGEIWVAKFSAWNSYSNYPSFILLDSTRTWKRVFISGISGNYVYAVSIESDEVIVKKFAVATGAVIGEYSSGPGIGWQFATEETCCSFSSEEGRIYFLIWNQQMSGDLLARTVYFQISDSSFNTQNDSANLGIFDINQQTSHKFMGICHAGRSNAIYGLYYNPLVESSGTVRVFRCGTGVNSSNWNNNYINSFSNLSLSSYKRFMEAKQETGDSYHTYIHCQTAIMNLGLYGDPSSIIITPIGLFSYTPIEKQRLIYCGKTDIWQWLSWDYENNLWGWSYCSNNNFLPIITAWLDNEEYNEFSIYDFNMPSFFIPASVPPFVMDEETNDFAWLMKDTRISPSKHCLSIYSSKRIFLLLNKIYTESSFLENVELFCRTYGIIMSVVEDTLVVRHISTFKNNTDIVVSDDMLVKRQTEVKRTGINGIEIFNTMLNQTERIGQYAYNQYTISTTHYGVVSYLKEFIEQYIFNAYNTTMKIKSIKLLPFEVNDVITMNVSVYGGQPGYLQKFIVKSSFISANEAELVIQREEE